MEIILNNVTLAFNDRIIMKNFDLTISSGITAIYGPSGVGKTSLINMIMGLVKPTGGQISLPEGIVISAAFQEPRLFPFMTAMRNVMLPLDKSCLELARKWLDNFNIGYLYDEKAAKLSGGERQRVSLARAMAYYEFKKSDKRETLLILDEPFSSIDDKNMLYAAKYIRDCISDGNCIIISHDYEFCKNFAGSIIKLSGPPIKIEK